MEAATTAAVEATHAATMTGEGAAAAISASTTVSAIPVAYCTATIADSAAPISISAAPISIAVSVTPAVVSAMPVATVTPIAMTPIAAIPGAGANEESADKPAGTVKAVRRAGIRIVAVVAIRADRCRTVSIATVVAAPVAAIVALVILSIGALRQRQWCGQQAQREYPSKELLHIASPIRPPLLLLTRVAVVVRG
jgi:hypothetical protein